MKIQILTVLITIATTAAPSFSAQAADVTTTSNSSGAKYVLKKPAKKSASAQRQTQLKRVNAADPEAAPIQTRVMAGPRVGGGGQGFVCRNDDGTVVSAELLDLAEAEGYWQQTLPTPSADQTYLQIAQQYAKALYKAMPPVNPTALETSTTGNLPPVISYELNGSLFQSTPQAPTDGGVSWLEQNKVFAPGNKYKLPPFYDSHPLLEPAAKNCSLEQIAFYQDGSNTLHVVQAAWDMMPPVHKAALLVHEALYHSLRMMGETTSDRARKTVGMLFGGYKFDWILHGMSAEYLSCWSTDAAGSFRFIVYQQDKTQQFVTALFTYYDGQIMLSRTAAGLNLAPFAAQLGEPVQNIGNRTTFNKIQNPLLDDPNYSFGVQTDNVTGAMSMTLEAVVDTAGTNALPIVCKKELSAVRALNGEITVGPASFPSDMPLWQESP